MKFKINTPEIKFAKDQKTIDNKILLNFQKNINFLLSELDKSVDKKEEHSERTFIMEFLKNTDYQNYTLGFEKNNIDLSVIVDDKIEVLIETKSSNEKRDMVSIENLNVKPLHQIIYYFMQERIAGNNSLKNLVITNGYSWYIFDAEDFNTIFFKNKELRKYFNESHTDNSTQNFYDNIAKPFIDNSNAELRATHFNLQDYKDKKTTELISLFKQLSSASLLKKKVKIDSNKLNTKFFKELLHIMGLEEQKDGGKKLIKEKKKPDEGSMLENVKAKIESHGTLDDYKDKKNYGNTYEQQLYEISLELVLTWINRLLFLKLLEGQLVAYHNNDEKYKFLSYNKVTEFDILDTMFFEVLNLPVENRKARIIERYPDIPYLNSSLFEPSDLEKQVAFISALKDNLTLPLMDGTVLSNEEDKELPTLDYLLKFLDAYNFASHTEDEIYTEKGELINASVLGLVFEKINGYKDGSFFTPGFITEYMARETIRRAVIQKYNEKYNLKLKEFSSLKNYITAERDHTNTNNLEYNAVINSLKIIDPAVGSGHFLVSSLNEIIAIKSELKILADENGELLNCVAKIDNDSLVITENNLLFTYTLDTENKIISEKNKIQKAIFNEKKTIIENCLFGVDINPKSVKITHLRLWIELLKNAYYKDNNNLETLPNIDINIKTGNSLISRFGLDTELSKILKDTGVSIKEYQEAIKSYHQVKQKDDKRELRKKIKDIKEKFNNQLFENSKIKKELAITKGKFESLEKQKEAFELSKNEQKKKDKDLAKLKKNYEKLKEEYNEIRNGEIYRNAFEWRFEFPEVLDKQGNYIGFDVVIGNPPYGVSIKGEARKHLVQKISKVPDYEIYYWFIDRSHQILKEKGLSSYIIPNTILFNVFAQNYRLQLFEKWGITEMLDCTDINIFEEATVRNVIFQFIKNKKTNTLGYRPTKNITRFKYLEKREYIYVNRDIAEMNNQNWALIFKLTPKTLEIVKKIKTNRIILNDLFPETSQGLIAYDKYKGQSEDTIKNRIYHHFENTNSSYKKWLYGEDVIRYSLKWNKKEYIDYCEGIANPRNPTYFKGKRILIREITNPRIFATITDDELYNDPAILIIKENIKSFSIESLLAIINSKLATFYHFNSSPKATKGAFPKILVYDVNNFPLPKELSIEKDNELKNITEQILALKKENPSADTSQLEKEIDQMVYQLYELTDEEIKIVEENIK